MNRFEFYTFLFCAFCIFVIVSTIMWHLVTPVNLHYLSAEQFMDLKLMFLVVVATLAVKRLIGK